MMIKRLAEFVSCAYLDMNCKGLMTPDFLMAVSTVALFVRPEGKFPNDFLLSTYVQVQGIT